MWRKSRPSAMPIWSPAACPRKRVLGNSQRVHADVEDLAEVEPVGELELKGFAKPVPALNLLALKEGATQCGHHKAGPPERKSITLLRSR